MSDVNNNNQIVNEEVELYKKVKKRIDYFKVAKLLNFTPIEYQKKILEKQQKGDFDVGVALLARRSGKSTIMSIIAITELLIPYASVLLITPTFTNAKAIFDKVERGVNKLTLPIKSKDSKALTFTLENGARFSVVSQKNYESALGQFFSLVIVDETGSIDNILEIWETYINPAQNDYGINEDGYKWSKTWFIGTARSYDTDFYKIWKRAEDNEQGYWGIKNTIYDNPLIAPQLVEKLKESLPQRAWEQEYLCIWQTLQNGDSIFHSFNYENNVIKHKELLEKITPEGKYITGIDIGFQDNTAFLIAYIEPLTGVIYVLDEYFASQKPLSEHIKTFRSIEKKYTPYEGNIFRFIDPSASQTAYDMAYDYSYFTNPAPVQLIEPIRWINEAFLQEKLIISDNCNHLIHEIKVAQWKDGKQGQVARSKEYGHFDLSTGALRYLYSGWAKLQDMKIQTINF